MNGKEEYNKYMEERAMKVINDNKDKPYLEGYYYYALSSLTYSSAFAYLFYVSQFLNDINIMDIKEINIDAYTRYMSKIHNMSSSHRIAVYSALKKFSKYLKANGLCDDYMQFISKPKFFETQETKDKREKGYLTKSEAKKVVNNVGKGKKNNKSEFWKLRDEVVIHIFLNTGIRCAALFKLDCKDIDIENKTINVFEKGEKARKIDLNDKTINIIEKYIACRKKYLGSVEESALLISQSKSRLGLQGIRAIVKRVAEPIEDKNITPHKLRATYGTQLYSKTHDIHLVQNCMGHSSSSVTERYIRGQKNEYSKKAATLMENFLD